MKLYYITNNVGTTKYLVSFHNGTETHKDGSPFYGARCFKNKQKMNAFIKALTADGYKERVHSYQ